MVELIEESVKCPKEVNDIRRAIVEVVRDIKDGKDLLVVAGENLQLLSEAIAGLENIDDELTQAAPESITCLSLMAGEILSIVTKKADAPTA